MTGVCSTANVELVKSLGADQVVDYKKEDFTQNGEVYDVIFDAVGKISQPQVKASLKDGGAYLTVQTPTRESLENLVYLAGLLDAGEIQPVIDRRYPLEQVADAHRYVETGRKKGNVVIDLSHKLEN